MQSFSSGQDRHRRPRPADHRAAGPARPPVGLPAHLAVSAPSDAPEREADRAATRVLAKAEPVRPCPCGGGCPDCRGAPTGAAVMPPGLPPIVAGAVSSGGAPLPPRFRAVMEAGFGQDLRRVRLHAGDRAARSAESLGATAYTVGSHIVLGHAVRSAAPGERRRLLAHELAHVVQQSGTPAPALGLSPDRSGRIAREPQPGAVAPAPTPAATPKLAELNGWDMASILSRLDQLDEATLLALKDEAKTAQGLNGPRLQLALDVVYTRKFSRAVLPEFQAVLPSRMESVIPVLQNADQQEAIKAYLNRPSAKPKDAGSSGTLSAPLGAGDKPIPASQLKPFGTEEQTAFKRQVYEAHVAAAARARKFSMGVAPQDLMSIGEGQQLRKDAAPDMIALLAKARADLKAAQDAGDAQAQTVKSIKVGNSYRDTKQDFGLWDGYFAQYYEETRKAREAAEGGEHGPKAVAIMVAHYTGAKAAPGFSNHTSGIAVDFATVEGKDTLGSYKSQNERWKKSWLHKWLVANADNFNYEPLATEAFHWSHKAVENKPAEPPHEAEAK
jgi:hypothetical protein